MTTLLILARAVHLGACLLFFSFFASDRFVAVTAISNVRLEIADYWKSRLNLCSWLLLPVIFLSGLVWFVSVALTMSGQALQLEILKTVWTQTQFGTIWKWRLIFWFTSAVAAALFFCKTSPPFQKFLVWIQLLLGGLMLGSLAWAGHGQEGPHWHLFADILHLLIAGLWPAGLLPFALFLRKLRRTSGVTDWVSIAALVRRFSALSLGSVALLAATGLVNGWFLVGSVANLFEDIYGRWLLAKIVLFGFAVAIGAVNLLRLKPRLLADSASLQKAEATAAQLQFNVRMELIVATAIIIVVAALGTLPPATH